MPRSRALQFEAAATVFAELEATRSRHRVVELVAGLLARAGADAGRLAYLLQGQLRPPYEGVEAGLGEKTVLATLARAHGRSVAGLARRLGQLGDLGLVAAELAGSREGPPLTLREAHEGLLSLAHLTGAGAVERKARSLAGLLRRSGPREVTFLVRAAAGRLRLGVGDQTILEATALAALGDRRRKPLVEAAYNVHADLGAVVRLAFTSGAGGLRHLAPEPGVPVRPALAQRLPSAEAIVARLGQVQLEPKYDGLRLQLHRRGARVWVFSRRLEDVTAMFPELTAALRRQVAAHRVILEGEAVGYNPVTGAFLPFQVTLTRKRKTAIAEAMRRHPLRLFAFDLLYRGRMSCLPWPQAKRSRELGRTVRATGKTPIAVTEHRLASNPAEVAEFFDTMIGRGLEGLMAKRPDAPYQAGARGYDWVKLKRAYQSRLRDTVDLVLVGYQRGRGRRAALGIGSFLAAVYDPDHDRFRTVAKIGSGLTDQAWKSLKRELDAAASHEQPARVDSRIRPDVWIHPAMVVEVLADEITRSPSHTCGKTGDAPGYALRFPRYLARRPDRAPEDATTEKEILRLHRLQRPAARG